MALVASWFGSNVAYRAGTEACAVDHGDDVLGVLLGRGEPVELGDAPDDAAEAADLGLEVWLWPARGQGSESSEIELLVISRTDQIAGGFDGERGERDRVLNPTRVREEGPVSSATQDETRWRRRCNRAYPGGRRRLSLTRKPGNCSKIRRWVSPL